MSKCDNCGAEGIGVYEHHNVTPEFCPAYVSDATDKGPEATKSGEHLASSELANSSTNKRKV